MHTWQPSRQPDRPRAAHTVLRGGGRLGARAPWGPAQGNGWQPKLSEDGQFVVYGFWQTFIADLTTRVERQIVAPDGNARMHPLGFIGGVVLSITEGANAKMFATSISDFIPRDVGVPSHLLLANWGNAQGNHWVLNNSATPYCVVDGRPFRTDIPQQGCVIANEHLVTARKVGDQNLLHFIGTDLVRELPHDASWAVNEQGDVTTGYFGRVWLYLANDNERRDATITPWAGEGPGCPVRHGSDLWLWTPTEDRARGEAYIIGRRFGETSPIVVPVAAIAVNAIWNGQDWVVASNDANGRLTVSWVPMDAPRVSLAERAPDNPPPPPPPPAPKPPVCGLVYVRGLDHGVCPACLNLKQAHTLREPEEPEEPMATPNRFDVVQEEFDRERAEPKNVASAGELTLRVARRLYADDSDWGVLTKSPGEKQHNGHAIDAIIYKRTQQVVDIISDAGGSNPRPVWQEVGKRENNNWAVPPGVVEEPDEDGDDGDNNQPDAGEEFDRIKQQVASIDGRLSVLSRRVDNIASERPGDQLSEDRVREILEQVFKEKMKSLRVDVEVKQNGTSIFRHGHGSTVRVSFDGQDIQRSSRVAKKWGNPKKA